MTKHVMVAMLLWVMCGAILGSFSTIYLMREEEHGVAPVALSAQEQESKEEIVQPLIPMQIKFTFLTDEEFQDAAGRPPYSAAFTRIGSINRKCEIFMPVSIGTISFIPGGIYSPHFRDRFNDPDWVNMVIAHEILHCIRGFWH